jgi:hypothetical protein
MIYFRNCLLFLFLANSIVSFGQSQSIVLDWTGTERVLLGEEPFDVQTVKGFGLDNGQPFFAIQQKHSSIDQEVEIVNTLYEKIPKEQQLIYQQLGLVLADNAQIDAKIVSEGGLPIFSCYIFGKRFARALDQS